MVCWSVESTDVPTTQHYYLVVTTNASQQSRSRYKRTRFAVCIHLAEDYTKHQCLLKDEASVFPKLLDGACSVRPNRQNVRPHDISPVPRAQVRRVTRSMSATLLTGNAFKPRDSNKVNNSRKK